MEGIVSFLIGLDYKVLTNDIVTAARKSYVFMLRDQVLLSPLFWISSLVTAVSLILIVDRVKR